MCLSILVSCCQSQHLHGDHILTISSIKVYVGINLGYASLIYVPIWVARLGASPKFPQIKTAYKQLWYTQHDLSYPRVILIITSAYILRLNQAEEL
jgi:hypothetical protein